MPSPALCVMKIEKEKKKSLSCKSSLMGDMFPGADLTRIWKLLDKDVLKNIYHMLGIGNKKFPEICNS